MSKIARIYQGLEEIQKYYQGGVLQRLFFDWKHYIGNELNIEYAKECVGRNVVINGKTYQNLFNAELSQGHVYGSVMSQNKRVNSGGFTLDSTTYTIYVPSGYEVLVYKNFESSSSVYIGWANKLVWTNSATTNNIRIMIRKANDEELTVDEVIGKVILLKGDYTNTDLPNSINGIESASEREFVKSKNLFDKNAIIQGKYQNCNIETSNFVISNNANYCISGFINIEPNTKYVANRAFSGAYYDKNKNPITTTVATNGKISPDTACYMVLNFNGTNNETAIEIINNFQLEKGSVITDYEPFYEYYPVTIRNYNYQCETDNVVLPNGRKNSLETIDGKKVHTRRVGAVLLNGTQDMELANVNQTLTTRVRIQMNNAKVSKNNLICNWFIRTGAHGDYEYIIIQDSSAGICLFISVLNTKLSAPTVDGVEQYFNENPLLVFYELAEPVISELYFSNITYKLNEPLRSLPNGVCDTIEGNKLIQRIEKIIFDGSDDEKWANKSVSESFTGNAFEMTLSYIRSSGIVNAISDKFIFEYTQGTTSTNCFRINASGQHMYFLFNPDTNTIPKNDIDTWKAWLSENPVTVYYELETPIETEITPDMILINGEPITDTVGIELPDGTKDSIENGCCVKRVGKVVLDGSYDEKWKIESTNKNNLMNASILIKSACDKSREDIEKGKIGYFFFSDKLPKQCTKITFTTTEGIMMNNMYIYVRILLSKLSSQDIDGLRNYLSGNPVTVWYELATPIKIPLFSIKEGLTTLKSTNNINPEIELDCLVRDDFQNMCDNKWESGNIDSSTGLNSEYGTRIRLKNFIKVVPNTNYRIDITNLVEINNVGYIGIRYYDLINNYINYFQVGNLTKSTFIFTTPEDCYYIRFIAETADTNFKIYLKEVIE